MHINRGRFWIFTIFPLLRDLNLSGDLVKIQYKAYVFSQFLLGKYNESNGNRSYFQAAGNIPNILCLCTSKRTVLVMTAFGHIHHAIQGITSLVIHSELVFLLSVYLSLMRTSRCVPAVCPISTIRVLVTYFTLQYRNPQLLILFFLRNFFYWSTEKVPVNKNPRSEINLY